MIYIGTNYLKTPSRAKQLTREELISESNRLERLSSMFSDRDWEVSNEYLAQVKVLDKVLLDHMVADDMTKAVI